MLKPIKPGSEFKQIKKWEQLEDELDELKKIYFSFLKRWTDVAKNKDEPNRAFLYDVQSDDEPLVLKPVISKQNTRRR